MTRRLLASALHVAIACTLPAGAAPPAASGLDPATCDRFATLPNAPMSAESCRKMMQIGMPDPLAQRAGDDAMTCAQIDAEMVKLRPKGISAAEAKQHQAAIEDGRTLLARRSAEAATATAPHVAAQTAIAMTPMPNSVASALNAPHQAEVQRITGAAGRRYVAEQRQSTAGTVDMIGSKLGDPRLMRLAQLSAGKHCPH